MIVTFCGHSKFSASMEYERKILSFLEEWVGDNVAEMYLGGYGEFDGFAYTCCKKYKKRSQMHLGAKANAFIFLPLNHRMRIYRRLKIQQEIYQSLLLS